MTTEHTFDTDLVSDLYKDAYGMRPTCGFWNTWNDSSEDQRQVIWDALIRDMKQSEADDARRHDEAAVAVEKRINEIRDMVFGATREDAVRYMHDAEKTDGDDGYLEFHLGLRYGYFARTAK